MKNTIAAAKETVKLNILLFIFFVATDIVKSQVTGLYWTTTGNSGTADVNYLGTIDPQPLIFKTSDTEWMRITPTGNIGINTANPTARFQVKNGSILFDGTNGNTPVYGSGTRMMWIPAKAAFRAGAVSSTEWDETNIGLYSSALGYSTTAQSYTSCVVGQFNKVLTTCSATTWVGTDPLFVVGNGVNSEKRANAVTVLKNGRTGIGTTTPLNKLDVSGSIAIGGGYAGIKTAPLNGAIIRGNVGIATATPVNKLDVAGGVAIGAGYAGVNSAPSNGAIIKGNVGIGTVTPSEKLEVNGLIKLLPASVTQNDSPGLIFTSNDDFLFAGKRLNHYGFGAYDDNGRKLYMSGFYGLNFFTGGQTRITINETGNVGIGTDLTSSTYDGAYKLAVNGNIRAKRVVVETGWSDFVFDKEYKLISLNEVENFIKQNGHLPSIPSAIEVETKGADLGELVKLQMQKIEELTLYIIEQNKKMEEMNKQIELLKK